MKTQLPDRIAAQSTRLSVEFHKEWIGEIFFSSIPSRGTIWDKEQAQAFTAALVHRYNAHSQLVKERDELLAALHECVQDLESNAENLFQLSKNTLSGHLHANRQEASRRLQSIVSLLSTLKPVEGE